MFLNLLKAATAVVATPVLVVADVLTLPSSGYYGEHPFRRTADALKTAGKAFDEAIDHQKEEQ